MLQQFSSFGFAFLYILLPPWGFLTPALSISVIYSPLPIHRLLSVLLQPLSVAVHHRHIGPNFPLQNLHTESNITAILLPSWVISNTCFTIISPSLNSNNFSHQLQAQHYQSHESPPTDCWKQPAEELLLLTCSSPVELHIAWNRKQYLHVKKWMNCLFQCSPAAPKKISSRIPPAPLQQHQGFDKSNTGIERLHVYVPCVICIIIYGGFLKGGTPKLSFFFPL